MILPSEGYENTKSLNIPVRHVQEPTTSQINSLDESRYTSIPDMHFAKKAEAKEGEYAEVEI